MFRHKLSPGAMWNDFPHNNISLAQIWPTQSAFAWPTCRCALRYMIGPSLASLQEPNMDQVSAKLITHNWAWTGPDILECHDCEEFDKPMKHFAVLFLEVTWSVEFFLYSIIILMYFECGSRQVKLTWPHIYIFNIWAKYYIWYLAQVLCAALKTVLPLLAHMLYASAGRMPAVPAFGQI